MAIEERLAGFLKDAKDMLSHWSFLVLCCGLGSIIQKEVGKGWLKI
jgi:hypothetical protein